MPETSEIAVAQIVGEEDDEVRPLPVATAKTDVGRAAASSPSNTPSGRILLVHRQ